jgi:imidazolonepropionase-like amidohydrolase
MELINAARVIADPREAPIMGGSVLIDAGLIVAVGKVEELRRLASSPPREIDLGARTLMPGLIDSHVHLGFDGGPTPVARMKAASDAQLLVLMLRSARELLSAGVTTARDLGSRAHLGLDIQEAIETGMADGPTLVVANEPITTTGGHCWFMGGEVDSDAEIRHAVRERHKAGANVVKVMSTGGFMTTGSAPWHAQFASDELRTLVDEARRVEMPVAAHAHGTPGIANAVAAGVTTLEHCSWVVQGGLPGDGYNEDIVDRIVDEGIRVCVTANVRFNEREPVGREASRRRIARMHEAGVRFIAGTDAGINNVPHYEYAGGLLALESAGLSAAEVLVAATVEAANACGLASSKGVLAPGMDADLIAVDGNPLEDLTSLRGEMWIMKGGRVIEFPPRESWPHEHAVAAVAPRA